MKYLPYQCASISCNEKKDFNSVPKLGPTLPQLPHPSQIYHQTTHQPPTPETMDIRKMGKLQTYTTRPNEVFKSQNCSTIISKNKRS